MSNGQGARTYLPEGAGKESARSVEDFLSMCGHSDPFVRRADGAARRDFLADEERDETARRLADERVRRLRSIEDAQARAKAAQVLLDAIDARIVTGRAERDVSLWVMLTSDRWQAQDACRLVCVSYSLWRNQISMRHPPDWPVVRALSEAEETGARAGRRVRDLGLLRAAIRPVRDEAVRVLAGTMKNVEIALMLGITPERVAQIKTGSG